MKPLNHLEKNIEYIFRDRSLLERALTHTSYANENKKKGITNNERLEYLGDSILDFIIGEYLFLKFPDMAEGFLTKNRAILVCEDSLYLVAKSIELGSYLYLGKGEDINGGRNRASILANTFEALIAAVYLDSNFESTRNFVLNTMQDVISSGLEGKFGVDYKTELQEYVQRFSKKSIQYLLENEKGPDHNKQFLIRLIVNGTELGRGTGKSKKEAEQSAAKIALQNFYDA